MVLLFVMICDFLNCTGIYHFREQNNFVPAEWPSARGDIWTLLSQARGAENHNYIVAVNCVGNFKGAPFYGHSMVVDPMGKL